MAARKMQKGCNNPLYNRKQGSIAMEHVVSRGNRKKCSFDLTPWIAGMIMHNTTNVLRGNPLILPLKNWCPTSWIVASDALLDVPLSVYSSVANGGTLLARKISASKK